MQRIKSADRVGQVFGRWTVLSVSRDTKPVQFMCRCACGIVKVVYASNLISGHSTQCPRCRMADRKTGRAKGACAVCGCPITKAATHCHRHATRRPGLFSDRGISVQKIVAVLGVSRAAVYQYAEKHGVDKTIQHYRSMADARCVAID